MLPECSGRHWGSTLAHLFHPATNIVGASGEKGLNRDLINRNPSLWEVRNHTLLPANTLTKVSWRDLPVPNFNSTAAKDTETHPHGPLGTHTPPVSSSPGRTLTHIHTHTHTHTRTHTRQQSQNQLTGSPSHAALGRLHLQCSWCGCCPVACGKARGEHEGLSGGRAWAGRASPVPEHRPLHPRGSARPPGARAEPACLPRCCLSSLTVWGNYTDERTKGCQVSVNINCAFFF